MVWGPATFVTESIVMVVPLAVTESALTLVVVALPSAFKCTDALVRFKAVSGAAVVPALLDTTSVPPLTLTVLMPPPAAMFPLTVPLVTFSVPVTSDAFAPAAAWANTMYNERAAADVDRADAAASGDVSPHRAVGHIQRAGHQRCVRARSSLGQYDVSAYQRGRAVDVHDAGLSGRVAGPLHTVGQVVHIQRSE